LRSETERYKQGQAQFDADLESYKLDLNSYNRRVDSWNSSGGAPPDVVAQFDTEKKTLARQKLHLKQFQVDTEAIRTSANKLAKNYNDMLARYNQFVQTYNIKFGHSVKLKVGECLSSGTKPLKISIFAFEDTNELTMILAHELGHALGMKHVKGKTALMRAVEEGETPNSDIRITDPDRAELRRSLGS
jgi:hypothetical protein